jgi:hypothetical protein
MSGAAVPTGAGGGHAKVLQDLDSDPPQLLERLCVPPPQLLEQLPQPPQLHGGGGGGGGGGGFTGLGGQLPHV